LGGGLKIVKDIKKTNIKGQVDSLVIT